MPKYYGCPCESCGKPLMLQDDIVVCPDCGTPYHRACYEKNGLCLHNAEHKAGFEWNFPYQDTDLRTCPSCGERTLRIEPNCRCCGKPLPPEGRAEPNDRAAAESEREGAFDYASFYEQNRRPGANPVRQSYQAAFGKEGLMDGIPYSDWMDFIGPSAPSYLAAYARMQLQHSKISMSFSALLFGPFYFFYRKAWKPAFAFFAAELLIAVPTLLSLMQISESTLIPALSSSVLAGLARVASVLSFVLMVVRGMLGKWLYRRSCAERIKRIRKEFPDPEKRRAVLAAQGGVSWAAVFGAIVLLMVVGSASTLLLGPNLEAVVNAFYA